MFYPVMIIVFVLILAGIVVLQIFLSRRVSRLPGLVLPLLSLLFSFLVISNIAAEPDSTAVQLAGMLAASFLIYNIPTLILLAIYFACRESRKKQREMDRMNAQDLE